VLLRNSGSVKHNFGAWMASQNSLGDGHTAVLIQANLLRAPFLAVTGKFDSNDRDVVIMQRAALAFAADQILNFRIARAAYYGIEQASQGRIASERSEVPSRDSVSQQEKYIAVRSLSRAERHAAQSLGLKYKS
jgi:hypothetical protein